MFLYNGVGILKNIREEQIAKNETDLIPMTFKELTTIQKKQMEKYFCENVKLTWKEVTRNYQLGKRGS